MSDWNEWLTAFAAQNQLSPSAQAELARVLSGGTQTASLAPSPSVSGTTWFPGTSGEPPPADSVGSDARTLGRYQVLSLLGVGGAGVVYRVWDPQLERRVALKVLHSSPQLDHAQARFVGEAQLTARLEHPGVVPVHTLERLPDGRLLFTMKEIHGETLDEVIRRVHPLEAAGEQGRQRLRRLVSSFLRVCEAVAYVHSQGIVHRDIKPANIMLGDFGQVMVVDWGLASRSGEREAGGGTPRYMAPEQAQRSGEKVRPTADVYALGAVLYELLCGQAPFWGVARAEVMVRLQRGERPGRPTAPLSAAALADICEKAMSPSPADRYPDAAALRAAIAGWLDGAAAAERAAALVAEAREAAAQQQALTQRAAARAAAATALLKSVPTHAPIAEKQAGWALEDTAAADRRGARQQQMRALQLLQAALRQDAHHEDAHALLATHHHAQHQDAERRGDAEAAEEAAGLLELHDRVGRYARYLDGTGALSLDSDPSGAEVVLYRYEAVDRRLVPLKERYLGRTPLSALPLSPGSYLLELSHPGHAAVRYPLQLGRNEHWRLTLEQTAHPVRLPPAGALDAQAECYVPAGWFLSGDPGRRPPLLPRRRLWCDGFIIMRFPITNAEFLEFVNDLLETEGEAEALRWAPQERPGPRGAPGAQLCGRDADGRFVLVPDPDGDVWMPDWPVSYVDWHTAIRYAAWRAARDGLPWRLPGELEWEKAARGADGRGYPWGSFADPTWCNNRLSSAVREVSTPVDSYPHDESPLGVRGMAGNIQDWCLDGWRPGGPLLGEGGRVLPPTPPPDGENRRVLRGGTWGASPQACHLGNRTVQPATGRDGGRSIRLLRPWPR